MKQLLKVLFFPIYIPYKLITIVNKIANDVQSEQELAEAIRIKQAGANILANLSTIK